VSQAPSRPLYNVKKAEDTLLDYLSILEDNDYTNMGSILKWNSANFDVNLSKLTPPTLANTLTSQLTLTIAVSKPSLTSAVQHVFAT
jgi:hypothetical protein